MWEDYIIILIDNFGDVQKFWLSVNDHAGENESEGKVFLLGNDQFSFVRQKYYCSARLGIFGN